MTRLGVALLVLAAAAPACRGGAPPSQAEAAAPSEAITDPALGYNLREGRSVFRHDCAPCHGAEGQGDGFNAYSLDPKPRDLTDPGFASTRSDEELAEIVRIGGGAAGLSTGMPPWGRTLEPRQIRNLVVYIRTLARPPEQSDHSQG